MGTFSGLPEHGERVHCWWFHGGISAASHVHLKDSLLCCELPFLVMYTLIQKLVDLEFPAAENGCPTFLSDPRLSKERKQEAVLAMRDARYTVHRLRLLLL